MTIKEIIYLIEVKFNKDLKPVENLILRKAWLGKTYTDMAASSEYGQDYLRKSAAVLWRNLSELFDISITKGNFRLMLENRPLSGDEQVLINGFDNQKSSEQSPPFPGSPLPVCSKFYIDRPAIEELAYEEVAKLGSVIRIKAPQKMGKNSLLLRILDRGISLGYRRVSLDFQQADLGSFTDLDKFLRWFCAAVSLRLGISPKLEDYWDETIGSKVSATLYFQAYLLPAIDAPLMLGLNEVNILFQYPEIAQEFLPMLRSWHEEAKSVEIWQNLRLIVVYSTEIYIPLNLNQSPFNIGLPLKLPRFTLEQIDRLAKLYQLPLSIADLEKLMYMVEGHPYLTQLAFHHLLIAYKTEQSEEKLKRSLEEILENAPTPTGIYRDHLRGLRANLYDNADLLAAFKQVMMTDSAVDLADIIAYKLESLGLVTMKGNFCSISCELYRNYFSAQLLLEDNEPRSLSTNSQWKLLKQLAKYKQAFEQLIYRDRLTDCANAKSFKTQMESQLQQCQKKPGYLILCQIDFLTMYNSANGTEATDDYLQQVAGVIGQVVQQPLDSIGRLGEGKLAVFLIGTSKDRAEEISNQICQKVKELPSGDRDSNIDEIPEVITVSIGVSTALVSGSDMNIERIIKTAENGLTQAMKRGGDRVVFKEHFEENTSKSSTVALSP